jgi:hypothetical protein
VSRDASKDAISAIGREAFKRSSPSIAKEGMILVGETALTSQGLA